MGVDPLVNGQELYIREGRVLGGTQLRQLVEFLKRQDKPSEGEAEGWGLEIRLSIRCHLNEWSHLSQRGKAHTVE